MLPASSSSMAFPRQDSPVRMQDVARAANVSAGTVSRALRDDPRISAPIRQKIKEAAAQMGYQPHPLVQALMVQRRQGRQPRFETIALVTSHAEQTWRVKDVCRWYLSGLTERAAQHGYRLEVFALDAYKDDPSKLARVLHTRGISGVILAFSRDNTEAIEFPVEHFSVVGLSTYFARTSVDRVNLNGFANVKLALQQLRLRGYRRPALIVPARNNAVVGGLWSAAALDEQWQRPANECCPPLILADGHRSRSEFTTWFRAHKPNAILAYKVPVIEYLTAMDIRVPEQVGVAHLFGSEKERASTAGIDGQLDHVGAATVDLLVQKLGLHAEGKSAHPRDILITGSWIEGPTVRPLSPV